MKTPHAHAALIKAWADGETIEVYCVSSGVWVAQATPFLDDNRRFRLKPEPKRYRVALFNEGKRQEYVATCTSTNAAWSNEVQFSRWLTDWVEYK